MAVELYNKQLSVLVRSTGRDDRRTHLWMTIEMDKYPCLERGRNLVMRLTDENDLLFLHTLRMADHDFQVLKEEERFLIDFDAFPKTIIDFLDLCIQEEFKKPPRYVLQLNCNVNDTSRLDVIETSEFQHVTRLKLRMVPGNDADVKAYLSECLKLARQERNRIEQQSQSMEREGRSRLQSLEEGLRRKTEELEQLHSEWNEKTSTIHEKYANELSKEREKAATTISQTQAKSEEEKRNFDTTTKRKISQLEAKNYELEAVNKDIAEKKNRMDGALRELKERMTALEEELQSRNTDLQNCRKQLSDNQGKLRDFENDRRDSAGEVKKHQEALTRLQERLNTTQEQNARLEKMMEQKDLKIAKCQKDFQLQTAELSKANDIIRKLQLDNRTINEKLKVRSGVLVQQENLVQDLKSQLERKTKETIDLKDAAELKDKDLLEAIAAITREKSNYAEAEKALENNANVITWLNRQLNALSGRPVQTQHTPPTLNPGFSDSNVQFARREQSSAVPVRQKSLSSLTTHSPRANGSKPEVSERPPRVLNISQDSDGPGEPLIDTKYFQSPRISTAKTSEGKLSTLAPVSALKTVSSAYFG